MTFRSSEYLLYPRGTARVPLFTLPTPRKPASYGLRRPFSGGKNPNRTAPTPDVLQAVEKAISGYVSDGSIDYRGDSPLCVDRFK